MGTRYKARYRGLVFLAAGCFVVFAVSLGLPETEAIALISLVAFSLGFVLLFLFFALHFKMAVEKNNPGSELNKDMGLTPSGYVVIGCSIACLVVGQAVLVLFPNSGLARLIENNGGHVALIGVFLFVNLLGGAVANALGYPVTKKKWW